MIAFFVVARYRHPLVPFVLLFSAAGAIALVRRSRRAHGSRPAAGVVAAAAIAVDLQLAADRLPARRRPSPRTTSAPRCRRTGRPEEAIDRYQRALAFDADYAPALNNLGTALRAAGRVDEAVRDVSARRCARNGDAASVHYNLGNALMARGDAAGAVAEFQRGARRQPALRRGA